MSLISATIIPLVYLISTWCAFVNQSVSARSGDDLVVVEFLGSRLIVDHSHNWLNRIFVGLNGVGFPRRVEGAIRFDGVLWGRGGAHPIYAGQSFDRTTGLGNSTENEGFFGEGSICSVA